MNQHYAVTAGLSLIVFAFLHISTTTSAQVSPQKVITPDFVGQHFRAGQFPNVVIDSNYATQIKAALLFYPELSNVHIRFRVKPARIPLTSRPTIWGVFQRAKRRQYLITISNKTSARLTPILLENLSFNAQIGVLGHEISHVAEYNGRKGLFFVKLVGSYVSRRAIDRFENNTDRRCIQHSLGYQLLAWSTEVRQRLNIAQWNGPNGNNFWERERYMSPASIQQLINY